MSHVGIMIEWNTSYGCLTLLSLLEEIKIGNQEKASDLLLVTDKVYRIILCQLHLAILVEIGTDCIGRL